MSQLSVFLPLHSYTSQTTPNWNVHLQRAERNALTHPSTNSTTKGTALQWVMLDLALAPQAPSAPRCVELGMSCWWCCTLLLGCTAMGHQPLPSLQQFNLESPSGKQPEVHLQCQRITGTMKKLILNKNDPQYPHCATSSVLARKEKGN